MISSSTHTIGTLLQQRATQFSTKPCLHLYDPLQAGGFTRSLSFAEFDRLLQDQAAALQATHALRPGDCIGLLADNSLEWIILAFAAVRAGLSVLPLSPRLLPEHLRHLTAAAQCRHVFASADLTTLAACTGCPHSLLEALPVQVRTAAPAPATATVPADAAAFILHTSGSTGLPRLVPLTHANILANQAAVERSIGKHWTGDDSALLFLPLFHGYTLLSQLLRNLTIGACTVVLNQAQAPTPEGLAAAIRHSGVSFICCVPWMLKLLQERILQEAVSGPSSTLADLQRLRFVITGGAALDRATGDFLRSSGVRLVTFFGLTEASGFVLHSSFDVDNWEALEAVDDPGIRFVPLSAGASEHELVLQDSAMLAHNPELAEAGRYATADLFRHSAAGWVHIGRQDLVYNGPHGEKVNPRPLETALEQLPGVRRAFVSGEGLLVNAALVEAEPGVPDRAALQRRLRTTLANELNPRLEAPARVYPHDLLVLPQDQTLPLTAKHTVDRTRALALLHSQPACSGRTAEGAIVAPAQIDSIVTAAVQQYLDGPAAATVSRNRGLVELGFDSLMTLSLRNLLRQQLGFEPPLELMLAFPSINTLVTTLQAQAAAGAGKGAGGTPAADAELRRAAPSDSGWQPIPLEQVLFHTAHFIFPFPTFNVSMSLLAPRQLQRSEVEAALRQLEVAHEVLRSVYSPEGDFRIVDHSFAAQALLGEHHIDGPHDLDDNAAARALVSQWLDLNFDLREGPVYRYGLTHLHAADGSIRSALYFGLHHVAGDFKGFNALAGELMQRIDGCTTAATRSDHYVRSVTLPEPDALAAFRQHWLQLLTVMPQLREGLGPRAGCKRYFRFDDVDLAAIGRCLRRHNISLYNGLYAVYALVAARLLPGQSHARFVTATAVTSRLSAATEALMGCFIHSPIITFVLDPDASLLQVMERVQDTTRQHFTATLGDPVAALGAIAADPAHQVPFLQRNVFLYRSPEEIVVPPTGWRSYRNEFFHDSCDVGMYFDCCASADSGVMEGYLLLNLHYADPALVDPLLDGVRAVLRNLDEHTLAAPAIAGLDPGHE